MFYKRVIFLLLCFTVRDREQQKRRVEVSSSSEGLWKTCIGRTPAFQTHIVPHLYFSADKTLIAHQ